jgi:copper chaperone
MTCGGCVASVTRAVQAVDAAARLTADLESHTVEVASTAAAEALAAAIEDAGFTVQPAA